MLSTPLRTLASLTAAGLFCVSATAAMHAQTNPDQSTERDANGMPASAVTQPAATPLTDPDQDAPTPPGMGVDGNPASATPQPATPAPTTSGRPSGLDMNGDPLPEPQTDPDAAAGLDERAATAPYAGALPPLIDRAVFFDDPEISGAQISPDAAYLTFMRPYRGERNIWIKRLDDPFDAAVPLTADDRPIPGYFWSRDGKYVLYVQDKGGDENYHVYAVDPGLAPIGRDADAGELGVPPARAITEGEGVRAQIVDVPRSKPGTIYVGLNDRDPAHHDLYAVDLATGAKTLVYENTDEVAGYVFDHAGALRLVTKSNQAGGTEVYRVDGGKTGELIYSCSVDETCYPSAFTADNRRLYFVSNKGDDADLTGLYLMDPATGATELVERDPKNAADFGGVITSDVTHELLGTVYRGDKRAIYWKDRDWLGHYAWLQERLPGSEVSVGGSDAAERYYLVYANSDTDPGATYLFDTRGDRELTFLYRPRPELPTEHLAEMQVIRYPSSDGRTIQAYLTLPQGVEARGLPLVVFPHGGPWARDYWGYNSYAQFLANRGYAVLQANFRGSTGLGKAHLNAGNGEWGTLMQDDLTWGVKHLTTQGTVDPQRVGIMGGSYGGYATLAGLAFTPDVYAAGVSIVGPSNLVTLLESIPPYWESFRRQMYVRMGEPGTPEGDAWLRERSPLNRADEITAPLLVVQGANDPRVKQAESDQIVVAMRELGRPVEYIVAPDEGHGFRRPENNMAMLAAAERFLAQHLGGRYQADMPAEVAARLEAITVDPATVTLAAAPSEAELSAPRPTPVRSLAEGTRRYKATMEMMGQSMEMSVTETVARTDEGNLEVRSSIESPMGPMTDVVVVAAEGLTPKRRTATQGPAVIEMSYPAGKVEGTMTMGGNATPMSTELAGELLSDGAAEAPTIATLPLAPGYAVSYWSYDLQTQRPQLNRLTVEGTEEVTVPAGTAETYRVVSKPADGSAGERVYFVETAAPHRVLKMTAVMPQMNGATLTTELVE